MFGLSYHSKGTRNYFAYGNPKVDELIDKAGSTYIQKDRASLYQEAAQIMVDDVPFVSTHAINMIAGFSKKVKNFVQYGDNSMPRLKAVWLAQ